MQKKRKWLVYARIITGIAVVGLLAFTANRGPLVSEFQAYESEATCLWCGTNRPTGVWDMLGTGFIILLLLLVPSGHILLLIVAAIQLNRSTKPGSSSVSLACPHCGQGIEPQWKACPHCGEKL